jgi:hypothetical protein
MAALDLAIGLGIASRNLPVGHPEVPQVPSKVSPKLRAMVRLDALDRHRQAAADLLDEVGGRFDGVVSIDAEDAIPGGLIDGGELVEAAAAELEVLDIDLDRLPRDVDLAPAARAWAIAFQGHPEDPMPLQDPLRQEVRDESSDFQADPTYKCRDYLLVPAEKRRAVLESLSSVAALAGGAPR